MNVSKSKVMLCSWRVGGGRLNVSLNWEMLEEMDHFKYFGSQICTEGGLEVDVSFRVGKARSAAGPVRKLWNNGGLRVEAKKLYKGNLYLLHYMGQKRGA